MVNRCGERLKQGERGEYTVDILFSVSINERYGSAAIATLLTANKICDKLYNEA